MNIPSKTGIITIENLPEDFMVDVRKEFKDKLFNISRKQAKSWLDLSKELELEFRLFNGSKTRNKLKQLNFFKKICKSLEDKGYNEFSLDELEKNIIFIKSHFGEKGIFDPKLPFNFNNYNGGCFIGGVFHDGSIKSSLNVSYCNKCKRMREKFLEISKFCFGDLHYNLDGFSIIFPKVVGELLSRCFNIKSGKKTTQDYYIPKFIFNTNKKFISGYLNFAVSDDGSVGIKRSNNIYRIRIGLQRDISDILKGKGREFIESYKNSLYYCPNILKANKILLKKLKIEVNGPHLEREYMYIDKENKKRTCLYWEISITNLMDIEKFYKNIELTHPKKQKKLESIMKIASKTRNANGFYEQAALSNFKH